MLLPILAPLLFANVHVSKAYVDDVQKWRHAREERLMAPEGWLSLVGLDWLKEGENTVGTGEKDRVILPKHDLPSRVGTITLHGSTAKIAFANGVHATIDGKPATSGELRADDTGHVDKVQIGTVVFYVIHRGSKYGVRIKDAQAKTREEFKGLKWYPVKPEWRITAKWVPFDKPQKLVFDSVIGEKEEDMSPGYAVFTWQGVEYKLQPTGDDKELEFVFRDKTAGKTTYPAARFLDTETPKNGTIILDFNEAYNPPCAFTPYATCPLPPPQNRLPFPVEAGEQMYPGGHPHAVPQ